LKAAIFLIYSKPRRDFAYFYRNFNNVMFSDCDCP